MAKNRCSGKKGWQERVGADGGRLVAAISQKLRGLPAPTMNRPTRTVEDREWFHEQDLLHSQMQREIYLKA